MPDKGSKSFTFSDRNPAILAERAISKYKSLFSKTGKTKAKQTEAKKRQRHCQGNAIVLPLMDGMA